MARMSPCGIVILNSFPKASLSRASRSTLPMALSSSLSCVPSAPPLTAVLVSATALERFLVVFVHTLSVVFLGRVLLTNSSG